MEAEPEKLEADVAAAVKQEEPAPGLIPPTHANPPNEDAQESQMDAQSILLLTSFKSQSASAAAESQTDRPPTSPSSQADDSWKKVLGIAAPNQSPKRAGEIPCGVPNQHGQPCQRLGKCPFHGARTKKQAPKKGWTLPEHYRFLLGLERFGRGSWKEIAYYVGTKSATQIQSHAQKYFLRRAQTTKNKRSIHDYSLQDLEIVMRETQGGRLKWSEEDSSSSSSEDSEEYERRRRRRHRKHRERYYDEPYPPPDHYSPNHPYPYPDRPMPGPMGQPYFPSEGGYPGAPYPPANYPGAERGYPPPPPPSGQYMSSVSYSSPTLVQHHAPYHPPAMEPTGRSASMPFPGAPSSFTPSHPLDQPRFSSLQSVAPPQPYAGMQQQRAYPPSYNRMPSAGSQGPSGSTSNGTHSLSHPDSSSPAPMPPRGSADLPWVRRAAPTKGAPSPLGPQSDSKGFTQPAFPLSSAQSQTASMAFAFPHSSQSFMPSFPLQSRGSSASGGSLAIAPPSHSLSGTTSSISGPLSATASGGAISVASLLSGSPSAASSGPTSGETPVPFIFSSSPKTSSSKIDSPSLIRAVAAAGFELPPSLATRSGEPSTAQTIPSY